MPYGHHHPKHRSGGIRKVSACPKMETSSTASEQPHKDFHKIRGCLLGEVSTSKMMVFGVYVVAPDCSEAPTFLPQS